jgi:hypothetical protein
MTDTQEQRELEKAIEFLCDQLTGDPPRHADKYPVAFKKIQAALERGWHYKKAYEELVERQ